MSATNKLQPVPRLTFNTASLTGSYQTMAEAGFEDDIVIFQMYNSSSNDVDVSFDGSEDHNIIPAGGLLIIDIQANKEGVRAAVRKGQQVWLKGTAGAGTCYAMGWSLKRDA